MMLTGLGWLTFIAPSGAVHFLPYNVLVAVLGEVAVILWLLVKGVNEARWLELANGSGFLEADAL